MSKPARTTLARLGRGIAALAICSVGAAILAFAARHNADKTDFISYWAAGQQLVHRLNPYDGAAILRIENQAGYGAQQPFFMRNPPWALFLALPLGFVQPVVGSFFWSCGLILALIGSVRLFWATVDTQDDTLRLISYVSAPAAICLLQQQMGLFLLLGFVLFLHLLERRPSLAGAALLLPALKPHLAFPFWIVLLLWSVRSRRWAVLGGLAVALASAVALAVILDPHAFAHYTAMVRSANIEHDFIPTAAQLLRISIHVDWSWLQLVPAAVACCWAAWYFITRRGQWDWVANGSVVLLVSVMTAPYAWFTDQSVLLVALMAGLYYAKNNRPAINVFLVLASVPFVQIVGVGQIRSFWLVWTTPAWLLWYLYATRTSAQRPVPAEATSA